MRYFVQGPDGQRYGPADKTQLKEWVAQGRVVPTTSITDSDGKDLLAAEIIGLFPDPEAEPDRYGSAPPQVSRPTPPPPSPYPVPPGQTSFVPPGTSEKKIVAGILGLLLGGFGIHKFYLGYTVAGVLQIVITFVTCGIGSILGLVEGIIYLVKSDQDFARTYILNRREWF